FSANNYLAMLITGLPSQLMPSLILTHLGSSQAAFFSMAWTISGVLYIVPTCVAQSLLAEGSHEPKNYLNDLRRAAQILASIVLPMVTAAILVAPFLLQIFGHKYAVGATAILQLLALGTIFLSVTSLGGTMLNIQHRSGLSAFIQLGNTLMT